MDPAARYDVPEDDYIQAACERAITEGVNPAHLTFIKNGYTAVAGILTKGKGPVLALRFDMDALPLSESQSPDHLPQREGFGSIHPDCMHACGHDLHMAIGLGVAKTLASSPFNGTLKLIFQPAEEGVRGAGSIVKSGFLEDVDYILAQHVWSQMPLGEIVCAMNGTLATHKLDVRFSGQAAHAGINPREGKNALLAAAKATVKLHQLALSLPEKHWVNCAVLQAGNARNIIPDEALLKIETRAPAEKSHQSLYQQSLEILEESANAANCQFTIEKMGEATAVPCSEDLAKRVYKTASEIDFFHAPLLSDTKNRGSEDFTIMLEKVKNRGGQGTFIGIGAQTNGHGHHTSNFDVDEAVMEPVCELLCRLSREILR